jgi:hypothetical protein
VLTSTPVMILLQVAACVFYVAAGFVMRHLIPASSAPAAPAPAPAAPPVAVPLAPTVASVLAQLKDPSTVLGHVVAELEAQGVQLVRGMVSQALQPAVPAIAPAPAPAAPTKG